MQRLVFLASLAGCASLALVSLGMIASPLHAQAAANQTSDVFDRMRADLLAARYAAVIARGNGLLESARRLSTPERIQLWQLLAAAYYPAATAAQQPDSARLPLEALIRLAPDISVSPDLSWPGLVALTERVRAESFAVVSRPLSEYNISAASPGHLTVVASRPTRFRLTSEDQPRSRAFSHDSSGFVTVVALQLRSHEGRTPIFADGPHVLHIWAYDSTSGDSVRLTHRVLAARRELAAPRVDTLRTGPPSVLATPAVAVIPRPSEATGVRRHAMLWGGLVLAAATAVLAQEARPNDGLRSSYPVDPRAFAVGAAMAVASITNFLTRRATVRPRLQVRPAPPAPRPSERDRYQVRLLIDPAER